MWVPYRRLNVTVAGASVATNQKPIASAGRFSLGLLPQQKQGTAAHNTHSRTCTRIHKQLVSRAISRVGSLKEKQDASRIRFQTEQDLKEKRGSTALTREHI